MSRTRASGPDRKDKDAQPGAGRSSVRRALMVLSVLIAGGTAAVVARRRSSAA